MILALAGNPNCGKTTLFNALTGANARTGIKFVNACLAVNKRRRHTILYAEFTSVNILRCRIINKKIGYIIYPDFYAVNIFRLYVVTAAQGLCAVNRRMGMFAAGVGFKGIVLNF